MAGLVIGFDGRWYQYSGVGRYVVNLLEELGKIDHGHTIIVYEDPNNPVPVSSPSIRKVPIGPRRYSISSQLELAWRCRRDRLDVFHSPFYMIPFLASCPVVTTVHDLIPFLFPIYGRVHRELVKAGYRAAVRKATEVIADSQTTANDLRRILSVPEDRIATVYIAHSKSSYSTECEVDEPLRLQNKYGISQPYVLTISAKNWRTKNLGVALTAIKRARESCAVKFQTVVAGPEVGLNATGLREQIPGLVATGFVPDEDLPLLYRNASAFVNVSLYEGFGIPLLEAMACGCPCVTSTGGSLPEIAADAAAVHSPDDAEGMARSIARLLNEPEYHATMSARGTRRAAEFSYRKTAIATLKVYERSAISPRRTKEKITSE
jgi:glycosyltransferase involved in cell wall biosynthesis